MGRERKIKELLIIGSIGNVVGKPIGFNQCLSRDEKLSMQSSDKAFLMIKYKTVQKILNQTRSPEKGLGTLRSFR